MSREADEAVAPAPVRNPLTLLLLGLVRAYQLIVSPWFPQRCKYYPSCSAYAVTALRTHGLVNGLGLSAWRLLRCNPWSLGGVDHVPPRGESVHEVAPRRTSPQSGKSRSVDSLPAPAES